MRQEFAVTGLLLVVGLPTAFFADGGWDGVRSDIGKVASLHAFSVPVIAQATRRRAAPSQTQREAEETVIGGAASAAMTLTRTGTPSGYGAASSRDPYLIAPRDLFAAAGTNDAGLGITAGVTATAKGAGASAVQVANIANPKDYGAAFKLYALATDPNNPEIRYALARDFLDAATPDYAGAFRWLLSSADLGNAKAALDLSGLYLEGKGVERNYPQAYLWATIAARGLATPIEQTMAGDRINRLARAMTPAERTTAEVLIKAWEPRPLPDAPQAPSGTPATTKVTATG